MVDRISPLRIQRDYNAPAPRVSGGAGSQEKAPTTLKGSGLHKRGVHNIRSNVSAPGQRVKRRGLSREDFALLEKLQKDGYKRVGLKSEVKNCGSIPAIKNTVGLGISGAGGLQVCGMCHCGSRWCPGCWGKVSKARAEEVRDIFEWAVDSGFQVALVTLTAGHVDKETLEGAENYRQALIKQDISALFDRLGKAWRAMSQGRAGQALKSKQIGYIRAFELTLDDLMSENPSGVHGHFHVLLILDKGVNLERYSDELWKSWSKSADKAGLITSKQGYDFKAVDGCGDREKGLVAGYIVKGEKLNEKSISMEIAGSAGKISNGYNRISPEGLLRAIGALSGADFDKQSARLVCMWRDLEKACSGRRWITYSRDIRRLAGLGREETDEELALKEHAVKGDRVAVCAWEEVADHIEEMREVILREKEEEKWNTLILLLDTFGVEYEIEDSDLFYEKVTESMRELYKRRE